MKMVRSSAVISKARLRGKPSFAAYAKASMLAGAAAAPVSALANFSADYTVNPPANGSYFDASANTTFGAWTGTWNSFGTVNLNTTGAPSSISMSLNDFSFNQNETYTFLVTAAATGMVSFDYTTFIGGSVLVNYVNQTTSSSSSLASGTSFSANVTAGDVFGFSLFANYLGNASLNISNFSAPEPGGPSNGVPDHGSTLALLAVGFVGLLAYRATAQRRLVKQA